MAVLPPLLLESLQSNKDDGEKLTDDLSGETGREREICKCEVMCKHVEEQLGPSELAWKPLQGGATAE